MIDTIRKIIRTIIRVPKELLSYISLSIINLLPRIELFDRIRFILLRLHGIRGSGRFTILSPIEISPYCAQSRITINGPCFINSGVRFAVPAGGKIYIEDNVAIGPRVQFECMQHGLVAKDGKRPGTYSGEIIVKKNVWIGAGAIILANATIGENSVVAAGSVVTTDVPPWTMVAGVPAKFKKRLDE